MLSTLINLDHTLTLWINGSHSLFADGAMMAITSTMTWIPLAVLLIVLLIRNNDMPTFGYILLMMVLCVLFADQMASGICKPLFHRFRPTQSPFLMYAVDVVRDYRGGQYGFFSSHAANTFSLAVFISLLFRHRLVTLLTLSWAVLNGWSRIYLGVHYLGDVAVGTLWGCTVGSLFYLFFSKRCISSARQQLAAERTPALTQNGYRVSDAYWLCIAMLLTYFYVLLRAAVFVEG